MPEESEVEVGSSGHPPCLRVSEKAGACQERDSCVRIGVHVANTRGRCRILQGQGAGKGAEAGNSGGADVAGLKGTLP